MYLTIIRFAEVLSLGVWLGAIVYLTFGVAPVAFAVAPTRQLAGQIVGQAIAKLYALGYICAAVYAISVVVEQRVVPAGPPAGWLLILVGVMVLLVAVNQFVVGRQMQTMRAGMQQEFGSIDQTPKDHPLRSGFGRLHGVSSLLMMGNLLTGLGLMFVTVRRFQ